MNTFLSLLVTALQLKVAILGLPVEQQTILTPTIDSVIASIQTEIDKPQQINTPIETTVPQTTEPAQQNTQPTFGSVTPVNTRKLEIKSVYCPITNLDGYKYTCGIIASLTDNGDVVVGDYIKISVNKEGKFVNFDGPNFISTSTQSITGKSHRFSFNYISGYDATYLTNEIPEVTAESGSLTATFSQ